MQKEISININSESLDSTVEKANRLVELLREVQQITDSLSEPQVTKETLHCAAMHIKTFFEQTSNREKADFAQCCGFCGKQCYTRWLDILGPIFDKGEVRISMVRPERY